MRDGKPRWLVIAEGLAGKALQRYGVDEVIVHGRATGAVLAGQLLAHPFYAERDIPLVLADHVSAEDGTGAFHTAPDHGQEDFVAGPQFCLVVNYTSAQLIPVHVLGVYLPSTPPSCSPISAS